MGILVALVVIGIIIFFHEFGHYIFAKLAGCGVPQFSIGWGPKLFSFKIRETRYSFNLFSSVLSIGFILNCYTVVTNL